MEKKKENDEEAKSKATGNVAALLDRVSQDVSGAFVSAMGYVGDKLGLFKVLGAEGPMTRYAFLFCINCGMLL